MGEFSQSRRGFDSSGVFRLRNVGQEEADYEAIGFLEQDWGAERDSSGRRWRRVVDVQPPPMASVRAISEPEVRIKMNMDQVEDGEQDGISGGMADEKKPSYEEVNGKVGDGPVIDEEGLAVQSTGGMAVKKSYEEVHGKMPTGPVRDSKGLAQQVCGAPRTKKSYEETHGPVGGPGGKVDFQLQNFTARDLESQQMSSITDSRQRLMDVPAEGIDQNLASLTRAHASQTRSSQTRARRLYERQISSDSWRRRREESEQHIAELAKTRAEYSAVLERAPEGAKWPCYNEKCKVHALCDFLARRFGTVLAGWRAMDARGKGSLSFSEFCRSCRLMRFDAPLQVTWQKMDTKRRGVVTFEEHLARDRAADQEAPGRSGHGLREFGERLAEMLRPPVPRLCDS
ncbi:unnamed protein product [Effrenium voratum]|uniref:Uncharacterized protein n=1 Tax=Effrenium voratum TaxID=2562239 RepID=A0AA36JGZ3_9DINO|nr:unnamed protein product [Effrenium voratum]